VIVPISMPINAYEPIRPISAAPSFHSADPSASVGTTVP
jgi:hypothetical protein